MPLFPHLSIRKTVYPTICLGPFKHFRSGYFSLWRLCKISRKKRYVKIECPLSKIKIYARQKNINMNKMCPWACNKCEQLCDFSGIFLLKRHMTKMEGSMLNITYKDRRTNIWVGERTKVIDIILTVRKMKWSWARHINPLKDNRWTSRVTTWRPYSQEKTTRETSQAVERRPEQILERHDMADDSTRQGNLETACWGLRSTTGHNGCLMMMMMTVTTWQSKFKQYSRTYAMAAMLLQIML